ncbi:hypothetical protein [Clostridium sp. DJ247]|uniref:hypothetical protein n=1 Tax=Clostridium sp. DJ247 TaxID=2726188 RepID=UPI00162AAA90|nr:hypothetical protein [Clostridium sp. DJ247]MBC2579814.1 hypothetical protein [Clostridium sp. DJ247]
MLSSGQLLTLVSIIALFLLIFGRDVGARRAILIVFAVLIVCGACHYATPAPVAPIAPYRYHC